MLVTDIQENYEIILNELKLAYLPSQNPFFSHLATLPSAKVYNPNLLGQLHLRYQAACHATRVMVYYLPHLDSPAFRVRKLQIISDDDGLNNGDTHHYQLTRAFVRMGADIMIDDEDFGSLGKLKTILDSKTADFLSLVETLYPKSLGAWCVIEMFADDWMQALMNALLNYFPFIKDEAYFANCFHQGVEIRHAQEAIDLTKTILQAYPELLEQTITDARLMAVGLDEFWSGLDDLLREFSEY
ncbi:MAG: hypothetical protein HC903_24705 [Methylacidiphilales bacterium]|nr:hypothetical protein [Candidatus Methylacidiphilales bacterium]